MKLFVTTGKISAGPQLSSFTDTMTEVVFPGRPHFYFHKQNQTPMMQYLVKYELLISVVPIFLLFFLIGKVRRNFLQKKKRKESIRLCKRKLKISYLAQRQWLRVNVLLATVDSSTPVELSSS